MIVRECAAQQRHRRAPDLDAAPPRLEGMEGVMEGVLELEQLLLLRRGEVERGRREGS